jgi:hypothetical protein
MTSTTSNYSLAFPPLPWAFTHSKKIRTTANTSKINCFAPPKYPFYLKHTTYATLVTEQYHHLHNKRSRFNNCLEYNRELEEIDLRLPQYWNQKDKSRHLQVGLNGFDLLYSTGNTRVCVRKKKDSFVYLQAVAIKHNMAKEPATIRTNFPMRPQCGVYYFEIRVISKGTDGLFAVGFCTSKSNLNTLPGMHTLFISLNTGT